ncbi:MAG: hypothetical protein ACPGXX_10490, partial [Planctomycetaceae bacterium]
MGSLASADGNTRSNEFEELTGNRRRRRAFLFEPIRKGRTAYSGVSRFAERPATSPRSRFRLICFSSACDDGNDHNTKQQVADHPSGQAGFP